MNIGSFIFTYSTLKNCEFEMVGLNTKLIHADDASARVPDVVQPINVSTTFRYPENPDDLIPSKDIPEGSGIDTLVYSRLSHPNSEKVEELLGEVLGGYAVVYNSGLSAFFAALTYYNPKVLSIGNGYHGCHSIANIFTRLNGLKQVDLDTSLENLNEGDVVHLETPVNPEGISFDIEYYAKKAHSRGAYLLIDATFAPPPLQDPFEFGADMVMHSGTKYFGGHSDLLSGVLVTKDKAIKDKLINDRIYLGTNIASLEAFLLARSLRTFDLRIRKQSASAEVLVKYLNDNISKFSVLSQVYHSSLQTEDYVKKQLPNGYGPVFSIEVSSAEVAKRVPSKLKYFHHATSLGGVESLIEWRAMSDPTVRQTLLRVSVGIEDVEDLIADFEQALKSLN